MPSVVPAQALRVPPAANPQTQRHMLSESPSTAAKNKRRQVQDAQHDTRGGGAKRHRSETLVIETAVTGVAPGQSASTALLQNMVDGPRQRRVRVLDNRASTVEVEEVAGRMKASDMPTDRDKSGTYVGRVQKGVSASTPRPYRPVIPSDPRTPETATRAARTSDSLDAGSKATEAQLPAAANQTATYGAPLAPMGPPQGGPSGNVPRQATSQAQPRIKPTYTLLRSHPPFWETDRVSWDCRGGMQNMSFSQLKDEILPLLGPETGALRLSLQVQGRWMAMDVPLEQDTKFKSWQGLCRHIIDSCLSSGEQGQDLPVEIFIQGGRPDGPVRQALEPEVRNVW
ncbi:hypothetical protein ACHAQH_006084 [Verticillium albo-atrum]